MPEVGKTTGKVVTYGKQTVSSGVNSENDKFNYTMQLFGLPYQFLPSVDQRVPGMSSVIGRKYIENMILGGAVVTIIPGKPKYLPGVKDKAAMTNALIALGNGNMKEFQQFTVESNNPDLRLYDFQGDFINVYARINSMCRIAAGFLELEDQSSYKINGEFVNFLNFDWKNYRWDGTPYDTIAGRTGKKVVKSALKKAAQLGNAVLGAVTQGSIDLSDSINANLTPEKSDSFETAMRSKNYMQFFIESDSARGSENLSNNSEQSTFKQMFDKGSSAMRNISFMMGSGGMDVEKFEQLGDSAVGALGNIFGPQSNTGGIAGTVSNLLGRLLNAGKSVIKGENVIMPDIYGGTSNSKSYTITAKYKAIYGNRLSMYADVIVPTLHWVCLGYPVSTGANSYASPPLIKVYKPGDWTVNMGLIENITISKDEVSESWNMDGLCTEVTITVQIKDLYSDLSVATEDPSLFAVNSSLVEFLATMCGLDLATPQLKKKAKMMMNHAKNYAKDLPATMGGNMVQSVDNFMQSFTGL